MKRSLAAMFLLIALQYGCIGGGKKVRLPPPTPARLGAAETGVASWYGHPYHGRRTSNGEVYDMDAMTAAHLSLPFNTVLQVTNLSNGRSVEVRINDRGPFIKGRFLDLSREAARRLRLIAPGTARVRAEVVRTPAMVRVEAPKHTGEAPCPDAAGWSIQVGSFRRKNNAERLRERLDAGGDPIRVVAVQTPHGPLHRVLLGRFGIQSDGERRLAELQAQGFEGLLVAVAAECPDNISQNL